MTYSTSAQVVAAVAKANGVDHTALPPLYDVLDPDALDLLFAPRGSRERGLEKAPIEVRFPYAGFDVTITDGEVSIAGTKVLGDVGRTDHTDS